jgi:signal transduction histidine kinase
VLTVLVRTPLNSIINYLEVALEEALDERARQHLQRSLQASKSLVFQVNDLLNLTEAEDSDFSVSISRRVIASVITISFVDWLPAHSIKVEIASKLLTIPGT